ncbi:MAG: conserved membrane protein of unknown function [Promethearchaeota archaeon]|nr:MAG: conserved membrane protein of unknown function [Candidatus Lokiarchaeota archaeon]
MVTFNHPGSEREAPYTHIILLSTPLIFTLVWFLDSFFLNWTTILNTIIIFPIRLSLFIGIFAAAIYLIRLSHVTLFDESEPSKTLITTGIFKYTRNPLYLGILLIYVAMILLSISLISIGVLAIIALLYDRLATFEEGILEEMFGEEYRKYKDTVAKWIPKLF